MEGARHRDVANALIARLEGADDAAMVAERMLTTWREVDEALSPILGPMGVAALYSRTVHISSAAHPWLKHAVTGLSPRIDVSGLTRLLAAQDAAQASAASATLLYGFCDLLASLVGPSLASRLLADLAGPSRNGVSAPHSQP